MRLGSAALISAIVVSIGVSVWLTSDLERRPMITAAAHAAIRANLDLLIDAYADQSARDADSIESVTLCLHSREPLDFDRLNVLFADTVIRPVTIHICDSERVESNDAMFAYFLHWFDERGERAFAMSIPKIRCPTASRCIVDIHESGRSLRYTVEEIDDVWTAKRGR